MDIMKKTALIIALISAASGVAAQDYQEQFSELVKTRDTLAQRVFLEIWAEAEPGDADVYSGYFNYCYIKSREESVSVDTFPADPESLPLADSAGNIVGYMNSTVIFRQQWLDKAFEYIDEGIGLHPQRLDLRFGKIYVLSQYELWDRYTSEIIKAIDYGAAIGHAWTWSNDEPVSNGEAYFLNAVQEYQSKIYNTWDDNLLGYMRTLAAKVLQYYPGHTESMINIALTYIAVGEYDKGIAHLLKAEQENPQNIAVLDNIAQIFVLMGDLENAAGYYEKIVEYGNADERMQAEHQLRQLRTGE
jgi:tetratricopeptide (TPR) repeat protein